MLLVPKQLRRAGMTGTVPYYGGRFSPAQAYGASHPGGPPPSFADPMTAAGAFVRAPVPTSGQPAGQASPARTQSDTQAALQHLRHSGVISEVEFQELRARVTQ
jgi:hypothetical protein